MSELEQSQLDAIGLGLVAAGVFFSLVFYFGWDGGQRRGALADAFVFVLGKVAYLVPLSLLAAGAVMVLKPFAARACRRSRPGRRCSCALTLGFAAGSFGLGPPAGPRRLLPRRLLHTTTAGWSARSSTS